MMPGDNYVKIPHWLETYVQHMIKIERATRRYGIDPETIGINHDSWWIVETPDWTEKAMGVRKGDLAVGANDRDCGKFLHCIDPFISTCPTWRCLLYSHPSDDTSKHLIYYFKPTASIEMPHGN